MRSSLNRSPAALAGLAALAVLLAACGKSAGSASSGLVVNAKQVSGVGTVLVSPTGRTLYHLKPEVNGKIECTGSCTGVWPPLVVSGAGAPVGGSGVNGKLGTIKRPDGGTQVTYNGMPLYTYSGDTGSGQANGQGIQGVWFAVTASGGSSGSGSTSGGYGGGY